MVISVEESLIIGYSLSTTINEFVPMAPLGIDQYTSVIFVSPINDSGLFFFLKSLDQLK